MHVSILKKILTQPFGAPFQVSSGGAVQEQGISA